MTNSNALKINLVRRIRTEVSVPLGDAVAELLARGRSIQEVYEIINAARAAA